MRTLRKLISVFMLIVSHTLYSQSHAVIEAQHCFGGIQGDVGISITSTTDGGSVLVGGVGSQNGNTCTLDSGTVFIKFDNGGNVLWQKCTRYDVSKIKATSDGGFITIGTVQPGSHGARDVQVVKFDANGLLQWSKNYGGSKDDRGANLVAVADGYTFIADSRSNDGDVSVNNGLCDIWVVHINESGNIIWQRSYGGPQTEFATENGEAVIEQTTDGGYVFEANKFDGTKNSVIVTKLSATGGIIWERTYDNNFLQSGKDIKQTVDGGFALLGRGREPHTNQTTSDVWLFRLNIDGTIRWSSNFGVTREDLPSTLLIDKDGGFIIAANYWSAFQDALGGHGNVDLWILKIADEYGGPIEWSKTYGGPSWDYFEDVVIGRNGELLVAATTNSFSGDVVGAHGGGDIWFVKLRGWNIIKGTAFIDLNRNGVKDAGEKDANNFAVKSELYESMTINGRFSNMADIGTYTSTVRLNNSYYNVVPVSHQSTFQSFNQQDSVDFALQPVQSVSDYRVNIIPLTAARIVLPVKYVLQVHNPGTDVLTNKQVIFIKDRMNLVSASVPPASISGDTMRWTISSLNPTDTIGITLYFRLDSSVVKMGDILELKASIDSAGDVNSSDNFSRLQQVVRTSFDPNDKAENSGDFITRADVRNAKALNYTIRFQNTGTDTAFNVVVRDTLDNQLNFSSLEITGASHRFAAKLVEGNKLSFHFRNIQLPDSNVNEPASHGFISYRIKVRTDLQPGNVIKNTASIYFDFNKPVRTNTYLTTVMDERALPIQLSSLSAVLKNVAVNLLWKTVAEARSGVFEIERSINGTDFSKIATVNVLGNAGGSSYSYNDNFPAIGINYYRLKMINAGGSFTYSRVVTIDFRPDTELRFTFYPNPAPGGRVFVKINGVLNDLCKVEVLDVNGSLILAKDLGIITAYEHIVKLNLGKLQRGVYVIRLTVADKVIIRKMTIM